MKYPGSDSRPEPAEVERVFHAAAALPVDEQAAFLARACEQDRRLQEAVRLLLAAARDASTAWERSALDLEARQSALDSRRRPGEFFGPYRILRQIAAGGMGLVYEALRDDAEFHKRVAIKFVPQGIDGLAGVERFRSERQILAQLEHSNIARLLDGGTTGDGVPYLVMEYVDGLPIDRFVIENRLTRTERLQLFLQVCEAVQYAHRNLVVHRDLKPGNILVTSEGEPKLLDFGIAKLLTGGPSATTVHALTPEYASPEQVLGVSVSTATDIYSLGVLLFVLLAERLPYRAGAQPVELIHAICQQEPVWQPGGLIHGDLQCVLAKALRKEPERRYLSVEQFAGDVRRYLDGRPVLAGPDALLYRARKLVARRALPLAAVAAVLAAVLVGGLSTLAQSRRAERRFNEVRSLAHSFLFDVYDSISALPGSLAARRLVAGHAQQYLDSLARDASDDSGLAGELAESYLRLGDVRGSPYRANLGDTPGALESYQKALALLEREARRHTNDAVVGERLVQAQMSISRILQRQKNAKGAMNFARQAIVGAEALRERFPQNLLYAEKLSRAYLYMGQAQHLAARQSGSLEGFQQVLATYRKSIEIQEAAGPNPDESWQRSLSIKYFYVGYALGSLGDRTGDVSYYQQALDSQLKGHYQKLAVANPENPDAWTRRSMADGLADIGLSRWQCCHDLAGALRDYQEALERFQKIANADPRDLEARRDVAGAYRGIGRVLAEAGHRREALESSRKSLAIYEELQRADPTSGENAGSVTEVRTRIAGLMGGAGK